MPPTPPRDRFVLDRTRQAAPQIAEFLRARILALEIAPGTLLSRAELQERFGVSQTPVRDALLKLEEQGLVAVYPQYATMVSRVNLDQARQAHFLRRAVEADVARGLAEARIPAAVDDLRKANRRLRMEMEAQDQSAFLVADGEFHRLMYLHAGMMTVWSILRAHSGHLDRLRRLNLANVGMARVLRQHEALVDAIEAGDGPGADAALREHLSGTVAMLERVGADYPEFIER